MDESLQCAWLSKYHSNAHIQASNLKVLHFKLLWLLRPTMNVVDARGNNQKNISVRYPIAVLMSLVHLHIVDLDTVSSEVPKRRSWYEPYRFKKSRAPAPELA